MSRGWSPGVGLRNLAALAVVLAIPQGLVPEPLRGQEVSARAYLNQATVGVGRPFVVNIEISGTQSLDREPDLPDLSAFAAYLGSGSSTSMQMVNNRTTVSITLQLRYQALEEGTFQIPPFQLSVEGEALTTEPLEITISAAPPPTQGGGEGGGGPGEVAPEDLFVTAELSRSSVREGQPFILEYRIFTRVDVSGYSFTSIPEPEGFWVEELSLPDPPQVEQVVRNGVQYTTAAIRRLALIPTGPGERTLEPLGLEAQVRMRRRTLDPFESIFDRRNIFPSVVPASVLSNPVELQVAALPPGRPEPFSGVVGRLELTASLDQDSVEANEAVTLTFRAQGQGNFRAIPDPRVEFPEDFEVYPPEVSETVRPSGAGLSGSKTWEFVLIPRAPGTRTLPALSMGYFDTGAGAYRTVSTDPIDLVVSGEVPQGPASLVRGGVATLREDIRFIHLGPVRLSPMAGSMLTGATFWVVVLLPMMAVLGVLVIRMRLTRLEKDPAYARRRRAGRIAQTRLAQARRIAGTDKTREFYAEVDRALRGFIADKLDVAEAGMQMRQVDQELRSRGVSQGIVDELEACLAHCDRQRFAPSHGDAGQEERFLERVGAVMTALAREVGR